MCTKKKPRKIHKIMFILGGHFKPMPNTRANLLRFSFYLVIFLNIFLVFPMNISYFHHFQIQKYQMMIRLNTFTFFQLLDICYINKL